MKLLNDLNVLDLSRLLPGPFATQILAEMGANVLKVEDTKAGDFLRVTPPLAGGIGTAYLAINRGKRNLSIDLKKPEAVEVIRRLVRIYDIVVEGYRPGTLERLGIGYDVLKAANPGVILCSITGYGRTGPNRDRAGHDLNYQALSGVLEMTGRADEPPGMPGMQTADLAGSYQAVTAILAAVIERGRSGTGRHLDIAMCDTLAALQPIAMTEILTTGKDAGRGEALLHGSVICYNIYETKDRRYLSLAALEPKFFSAFCRAVDREDLLAHHFEEAREGRWAYDEMCRLFASRTRAEWVEVFKDVDACCEPVLSPLEVPDHPHFKGRNLFVENSLPEGGALRHPVAVPFLADVSRPPVEVARLGRDTVRELERAGYAPVEIERLIENGTVLADGKN